MRRLSWLQLAAVIGLLTACATASHAQAGRCTNAQINQAYAALRMTPNGSGYTGDCNPNNYGAGSWTGMPDLEVRIQHSHDCANPWLGQIYWYLYNRKPSALECTAPYSGGSTYMGLASGVQASHNAVSHSTPQAMNFDSTLVTHTSQLPALAVYKVDAQGNLRNASNQIVAFYGHYLINAKIVAGGGGNIVAGGGGNIVAGGGGNIVAGGGGNLISPQAGMVVNTNGSNFIVSK